MTNAVTVSGSALKDVPFKLARWLLLLIVPLGWASLTHANIGGSNSSACSSCHETTLSLASSSASVALPNGGDTTLKLYGGGTAQQPRPYTVTLTVVTTAPGAGFRLEDGALTSTFAQLSDPVNLIADGVLTHTYSNPPASGMYLESLRKSWTFNWTPLSPTETGTFQGKIRLVNGDTTALGDSVSFDVTSLQFSVLENTKPSFNPTTRDVTFTETAIVAGDPTIGVVAASDTDTGDTAGLSYAWASSMGLSAANIQAPQFTGSTKTTYTVTATDEVGAETATRLTVVVDVDPKPVAIITGPASEFESRPVTFSGVSSSDATGSDPGDIGTIPNYQWTVRRASNPNADFATGAQSVLTFTPPDIADLSTEEFTVTLTVTDSQSQSHTISRLLQVNGIAIGDPPPVVSAVNVSTPTNEGGLITLTAVASDNNNNGPVVLENSAFVWTQPAGQTVALGGTGATRTFTAPVVANPNQANQRLDFTVAVTGSNPAPVSRDVIVLVNNGPTASAGADIQVNEGLPVSLSGVASFDPGGGALTFLWRQVPGTSANLVGLNLNSPTLAFTAPEVGRDGSTLRFELRVADEGQLFALDTVDVRVNHVNKAPTADAGPDNSVNENASYSLTGSYLDPDDPGSTITFTWTQVSDPLVNLAGASTSSPSFTAPSVSAAGANLVFNLVVTDEGNLASASDTVTIDVLNVNQPPSAAAGPDQTVVEAVTVTLDGSNSDDDDDRSSLRYTWLQTAGPPVTLLNGASVSPSFTAPRVGFTPSPAIVFRLTVKDGQNLESSDDVAINVSNVNVAPVANAGVDQTVREPEAAGVTVTLDGRGSVDADLEVDDSLVFAWRQTNGLPVTLENPNTAQPTFAAPRVRRGGTALLFELTVTDRGGLVGTDTVIVNVTNADLPPRSDAGPDQSADETATVRLSGDNSSDVDGPIVSFAWRQIAGPAVTLSQPNASRTEFAAPRVAAQRAVQLQLTVTDEDGLQASDDVFINVLNVTQDPPTANAGNDQTVAELDTVTLEGARSFDPDGRIVSVRWRQLQGTSVILSDPTLLSPTFSAPVVGVAGASLVFQIEVTDDSGFISSDSVIINIANTTDRPPITDAGDDQRVTEGGTVRLDGSRTSDPKAASLKYLWRQVSGPAVILSATTQIKPTFVAPGVEATAQGTGLRFQLTVTADDTLQASDEVNIVVNDNGIIGFRSDLPTVRTSDQSAAAFSVSNGNLVALSPVNPRTIDEPANRPQNFYTDLFNLTVAVTTPGDTAEVTILLQNPMPSNAGWAKYSAQSGWTDFSSRVRFSSDRRSAILTLTDGGIGDDDRTANGQIVDPSGPAQFATPVAAINPPAPTPVKRSKSGGGCSIVHGGAIDPMLPLLVVLSLVYLLGRRRRWL